MAPTSNASFFQQATPEEKAAILRAEKRLNTRAALQAVTDPVPTGRWAKTLGERTVGAEMVMQYPGANSPWSGPQVGLEPPLGYSVEDLEPTGELHEVAAAIDLSSDGGSADAGTSSPATVAGLSSTAGPAAAAPPAAPVSIPIVDAVRGGAVLSSTVRRIG